jgi:hypothetical protein
MKAVVHQPFGCTSDFKTKAKTGIFDEIERAAKADIIKIDQNVDVDIEMNPPCRRRSKDPKLVAVIMANRNKDG